MSVHEDDLVVSAVAGVFPGADDPAAFWELVKAAQRAPLVAMTPRWGVPSSRIVQGPPGTRNATYVEHAHALPLLGDGDGRARNQVAWTVHVGEKLLAGASVDRRRVALVLGTSWSDESYFLADAAIRKGTRDASAAPRPLDPPRQLDAIAGALGLGGPAFAVDTACSSFLYALDAAKGLVTSGAAEVVVVAGVNAFLPSTLFLGFGQLQALAKESRLDAFLADASGLVLGECVAAVLVETEGAARAAGRTPWAVIRGTGLSSDGAEGAVFAPGREGQRRALARAYRTTDPATVDYVEGHGTGTRLGDATELEALAAHFGPHRPRGQRLPVGSVKALVGHCLAAAGAASLVKVLYMLREGLIPPHVAGAPHPSFEGSCLELPRGPVRVSGRGRPMRAGISAFAFGGANAHVVLEAYDASATKLAVAVPPAPSTEPALSQPEPAAPAALASSEAQVVRLDLALVAVDACLGGATDPKKVEALLRSDVASGAPERPATLVPFPWSRFEDAPAGAARPAGAYLRGEVTVDMAGLRMGPKQLAAIDPFKLLVTHRAKVLATRTPGFGPGCEASLLVCASTGGEAFLRAYGRAENRFRTGDGPEPDLEVAGVATILPSMVSGYPAVFHDLRGFHATLSGERGTFFDALALAPHWIAPGGTLVLGGGRIVSSPVDVLAAPAAPALAPGEGLALFAFRRADDAARDGDATLARIPAMVRGARSVAEAAALAGVAEPEAHEVCELDATSATERLPAASAQRLTGFLGDGVGVEALVAALVREGRNVVVEARRRGEPSMWLFVEKHRARVELPADPAPSMPFTLRFSRPEAEPVALPAASPAAPVVGNEPRAPGPERGLDLEPVASIVERTLEVRGRALALLLADGAARAAGSAPAAPLAVTRGRGEHVVVTGVSRRGGRVAGTLVVDETHPYFFDHPLDHVPGILLLAGVDQLAEVAGASSGGPRYVKELTVRFSRYVEKSTPARLTFEATDEGSTRESTRAVVSLVQAGAQVCRAELVLARSPGPALLGRAPRGPAAATKATPLGAPAKLLHKHRAENVLVGPLEAVTPPPPLGSGRAIRRVRALPLPESHFFADGPAHAMSPVYFLEVARQAFTLIAHEDLGVPLGTPMNIATLSVRLHAPIPRDVPLDVVVTHDASPWTGIVQTLRADAELVADGIVVGHASLGCQVMDRAIYELQRHAVA